MGFFNRTFGSRKEPEPAEPVSLDSVAAEPQVPSAPAVPIPTMPGSVPSGVGGMLNPPEGAANMYNPYAGLKHVGSGSHPAFRVSQQPEFVFQEDASIRRRGFGENLAYYTGAGYLGGAVGGGAVGIANGMSNRPEGLPLTRRLLLNRLLNSSGQSGRVVGNTLGCLGLLFAVSESFSWMILDEYLPYSPSWLGTISAGAVAGAIYRSPRGPRASAITAGVGAVAACGLLGLRQLNPNV